MMTPRDWKEVEERLAMLYSSGVRLRCDGYEVRLILERVSQFRNAIRVYVGGVFRGKWLLEDCEERRRFLRPVKRSLHSRRSKAALRKIPKRVRRQVGLPDPDAKIVCYSFYWTSFKALKAHLIKHNKSIELVREQPPGAVGEK